MWIYIKKIKKTFWLKIVFNNYIILDFPTIGQLSNFLKTSSIVRWLYLTKSRWISTIIIFRSMVKMFHFSSLFSEKLNLSNNLWNKTICCCCVCRRGKNIKLVHLHDSALVWSCLIAVTESIFVPVVKSHLEHHIRFTISRHGSFPERRLQTISYNGANARGATVQRNTVQPVIVGGHTFSISDRFLFQFLRIISFSSSLLLSACSDWHGVDMSGRTENRGNIAIRFFYSNHHSIRCANPRGRSVGYS